MVYLAIPETVIRVPTYLTKAGLSSGVISHFFQYPVDLSVDRIPHGRLMAFKMVSCIGCLEMST